MAYTWRCFCFVKAELEYRGEGEGRDTTKGSLQTTIGILVARRRPWRYRMESELTSVFLLSRRWQQEECVEQALFLFPVKSFVVSKRIKLEKEKQTEDVGPRLLSTAGEDVEKWISRIYWNHYTCCGLACSVNDEGSEGEIQKQSQFFSTRPRRTFGHWMSQELRNHKVHRRVWRLFTAKAWWCLYNVDSNSTANCLRKEIIFAKSWKVNVILKLLCGTLGYYIVENV